MEYGIAKQLKAAGFIFPEITPEQAKLFGISWVEKGLKEHAVHYKLPTLSELIEACGENFTGLIRSDDLTEWRALCLEKCIKVYYVGSTPEEAVAKLWLALNKK